MYKMHIISYEVQEYIITNTQNYRIFLQTTGFVFRLYFQPLPIIPSLFFFCCDFPVLNIFVFS